MFWKVKSRGYLSHLLVRPRPHQNCLEDALGPSVPSTLWFNPLTLDYPYFVQPCS
jgi:hypothetical protein